MRKPASRRLQRRVVFYLDHAEFERVRVAADCESVSSLIRRLVREGLAAQSSDSEAVARTRVRGA